jgi:hypothetical protein
MFGPQLTREVNRFKNKNQFKQSVDNVSMQAIITAEAVKNGYDKEKEIREQLDSFKNQRMLSLLNKMEVNDKVTVEDDEVKKYYQEHTSEFKKPAEILIWEIYLEDEGVAKKVLAKAKAGQDFEKVQARVKSKVKAQKIKDRKVEWEEELKNRYAVKINDELVENI